MVCYKKKNEMEAFVECIIAIGLNKTSTIRQCRAKILVYSLTMWDSRFICEKKVHGHIYANLCLRNLNGEDQNYKHYNYRSFSIVLYTSKRVIN